MLAHCTLSPSASSPVEKPPEVVASAVPRNICLTPHGNLPVSTPIAPPGDSCPGGTRTGQWQGVSIRLQTFGGFQLALAGSAPTYALIPAPTRLRSQKFRSQWTGSDRAAAPTLAAPSSSSWASSAPLRYRAASVSTDFPKTFPATSQPLASWGSRVRPRSFGASGRHAGLLVSLGSLALARPSRFRGSLGAASRPPGREANER